MVSKDVTFADLARERINMLGLQVIPGTSNMFASVEYQYHPQDAPHTWHKIVIPIVGEEKTLATILQTVRNTKAELER